jgi:UDP-N-acetylmuramate dehydrogenase
MALTIHHGASLKALNTLGVDAAAAMRVDIEDAADLPRVFDAIRAAGKPWLALGEGSNVLFASDFDGFVVRPTLRGIAVLHEDDDGAVVRAGAGENWHVFVQSMLAAGLHGLENLALIPGTVGAAPVQNIGAYGVELESRIVAVEAFDTHIGELVRLSREDCGFAYRDSRFKRERDRWLITAVAFALQRNVDPVLGYAGVGEELAIRGVAAPTPSDVFEAVCALRRRKLPDPAVIGNAGSFFKNPVVPEAQAAFIRDHHPDLPAWPAASDRTKLSAAWLIERAGLKGHRQGDAGISDRHALVLVNHGSATGKDLLDLARHVQDEVDARFGVRLEPEPRIVG